MKTAKLQAYSVERIAYSQKIAYSVERIADSKNKSILYAKRYPLNANKKRYPLNAKILRLLICSFAFFILHFNCYAQSVSSTELINNARLYDGKVVTYEGEVIGDIMVRGDYAWINVNDGQNAIGIWIEKSKTLDILYTGSHKSKGDWIEVTGVFHRACLEHGGDLDIHAQAIRKVRQGRQILERLNMSKRNLVFVLLGVLCLVWILKQLKLK